MKEDQTGGTVSTKENREWTCEELEHELANAVLASESIEKITKALSASREGNLIADKDLAAGYAVIPVLPYGYIRVV